MVDEVTQLKMFPQVTWWGLIQLKILSDPTPLLFHTHNNSEDDF